jgi:hypothetical protein
MEAREHAGRQTSQCPAKLHQTLGPILQQQNSIIKLDQADAVIGGQVFGKSFRGATKIIEVISY